jgi:two-component system, NtrC family, sensor kinase
MGRRAKPAKRKVETRRPVVGTSSKNGDRTVGDLEKRLAEAQEQQAATGEILRVISSSPTDIQPVLDAVAQNAARLCDANDALIFRVDGDGLELTTTYGPLGMHGSGRRRPISRDWVTGRAVVDRKSIHVHDLAAEPESEFPLGRAMQSLGGHRTTLATPLLREDIPLGAILIRRKEVRPFTDKQIELLEIFAAQAVIAIENVRLFQAVEARNRELTEALEQQTATSEILRVMSASPIDVQPVLDAVAEKATRLCDAADGIVLRVREGRLWPAAHYGPAGLPLPREIPGGQPINRDWVSGRAVVERRPVHVPDLLAAGDEYRLGRQYAERYGHRTTLAVPLLREGQPVGVIMVRRLEVRPFTGKQMALLQTFADQAVIAIENVRLFSELQARTEQLTRSVDRLTALGEVSRALSSTLDLDAVLRMIVSRASELAGADGCVIYEFQESAEQFQVRATHNFDASFVGALRAMPLRKGEWAMGRATETREPIQISDIAVAGSYQGRLRDVLIEAGYGAVISVPMVLEEQIIGSLSPVRRAPGEFSTEVVELLKNFATQSALAIQNARLFREIADKSQQLEAASRHKSEFLANMSHELRTPLNAIIGFSEVLGDGMFGDVNDKQREYLRDILESGHHLLSLINDILDLSKIEAGRMELDPTDFHLPGAIENALILVRERASRRGITLERAIDDRLGMVRADERKVKQVLLNLLSNALKFTPEGGRIDVRTGVQDDIVEISVTDTGVGIAPEDQEAVFEEFRQVGTADKRVEGTGLGLAISRKFIELHGGRIWVKSTVGVGSTFTFTLPVHHRE